METLGRSARHWRRQIKSTSFHSSLSGAPSTRGAHDVQRFSNRVERPKPTASKKCERQHFDCPCARRDFLEMGQREALERDLAVRPFPGLRKIYSRRGRGRPNPATKTSFHPRREAGKELRSTHSPPESTAFSKAVPAFSSSKPFPRISPEAGEV